VKQHFSRIADPIFKQAMGVDSYEAVESLPQSMVKWFADLKCPECDGKNSGGYKVIEVLVDEYSDDYYTT
jgi:hypothetical protein